MQSFQRNWLIGLLFLILPLALVLGAARIRRRRALDAAIVWTRAEMRLYESESDAPIYAAPFSTTGIYRATPQATSLLAAGSARAARVIPSCVCRDAKARVIHVPGEDPCKRPEPGEGCVCQGSFSVFGCFRKLPSIAGHVLARPAQSQGPR